MSTALLVLATSTGGVGRHVASLQDGLRSRGWSVRVACPTSTQEAFGFADHVPLEVGHRPHAVRDLRALATLRSQSADVVHAHGLRAAGLAAVARAGAVATWHNPPAPGRAGTALARVAARRSRTTLAVSADLADLARRSGAADVRAGWVAAPELRAATGADLRVELGVRGPLVLAVGRLHPQKGLDVLLAAVPQLAGATVVIAGDGPLRGELQAQAQGLPVRLLGHREDLADLYAAADVVALPSRWEGRPLTAMEALRAGRPLVTTRVGGVPFLVGDGAVLVEPDDPVGLALAVRALLTDPAAASALAARGRAVAATWPGESDVVDQVEGVYRELLR